MKKIVALILLIFVISSCEKEIQPIIFSEVNFTSEEQAIIEINIPKADTNSEAGKKINAIIEGFTAFQVSLEEETMEDMTIEASIEQFNKEYRSFTEKFSENSQPWEAFVDGEVTYQSSEIISIALNTYLNTGGAHGNSVIHFLNFNPSTGETYKKEDVLAYIDTFETLVIKHFKKTLEEEGETFSEFKFPETIGFSDDGIIIVYNQHELEAYSLKMLEFTIPFDEVNPFLNIL